MAMPSSLSLVALLTTAILSADGSTVLVETVGELKAAILDASVSTIEIEAGSPYMLDSTLDISRSVALRAAAGQRATLDGGGARRVMSIRAGAVSLTGLVLTRGRSSNGAGLYVRDSSSFGGLDPPVVTIADCVFSENVAAYNSAGGPCVGEPARGAGIYVDSGTSLTMTASQVKSNSGPPACNTGRPAEAFGIGLFVAGEASISNCAIKENAGSRADGGGLFVAGGAKVSMVSTTVVDNVAVCAAVPPCSPLHAHPSMLTPPCSPLQAHPCGRRAQGFPYKMASAREALSPRVHSSASAPATPAQALPVLDAVCRMRRCSRAFTVLETAVASRRRLASDSELQTGRSCCPAVL